MMRRILSTMTWVIEKLTELQMVAAIIVILSMLCVVIYGVITRYVFKSPEDWPFEFSCLSFVALIAFALAFTQKRRGHISIEFVVVHLPTKVQRLLGFITRIMFLSYAVSLLWFACLLFLEDWETRAVSQEAEYPLFIPELALVIGIGGLCLQLLMETAKIITNLSNQTNDRENGAAVKES